MKRKQLNLLLLLGLPLLLNACRYSDEFAGTFNNTPATLSAYSKNTDKYCIALNLTAGTETRKSFISAKSAFDERDLTKPKSFNTKNEPCSANLDEYLIGVRSSKIVGTSMVTRVENLNPYLCQMVYYNQFAYTDQVQIDFRNKLSDQSTGNFSGTGQVQSYTDFSRPLSYGPVFRCNGGQFPYPYPYPPYPRRGGFGRR
jgi:hypothetical protein